MLKVNKVDRVALAPYTLATKSTVSTTKSTELATMSTATSCQTQIAADLSPKPATKSTVSATVDFVADLSPVSAIVDSIVASVYRAQEFPGEGVTFRTSGDISYANLLKNTVVIR